MDFTNRLDITPTICNTWRLIMTEEEIKLAVQKCADYININFANKPVSFICILKGAAWFFTDLTRKINISYKCHFIQASSDHSLKVRAEPEIFMFDLHPSELFNRYLILVDELFVDGLTLNKVKTWIGRVSQVPQENVFTCCLFKKIKSGLSPSIKPDIYGAEVPDVWLVGNGIDDYQEKRGWPCLYGIPKPIGVQKTSADIIFDDKEAYQKMRSIYEKIDINKLM